MTSTVDMDRQPRYRTPSMARRPEALRRRLSTVLPLPEFISVRWLAGHAQSGVLAGICNEFLATHPNRRTSRCGASYLKAASFSPNSRAVHDNEATPNPCMVWLSS